MDATEIKLFKKMVPKHRSVCTQAIGALMSGHLRIFIITACDLRQTLFKNDRRQEGVSLEDTCKREFSSRGH